jgi:hypothetical protein
MMEAIMDDTRSSHSGLDPAVASANRKRPMTGGRIVYVVDDDLGVREA